MQYGEYKATGSVFWLKMEHPKTGKDQDFSTPEEAWRVILILGILFGMSIFLILLLLLYVRK